MIGSAGGLIISAPASGSGKTVVTLGLLRSLARAGGNVVSAKVGPDYIDPAFHKAASGRGCRNLDTWAMRPDTLALGISALSDPGQLIICEGVMGLFDGARGISGPADGSTASLAKATGWPVILVVDAAAQAASVAALVRGFAFHDPTITLGGVMFNRVGSDTHAAILRDSMATHLPSIPVIGCLKQTDEIGLPSRHLGLVQALEHQDLPTFLDRAADWIDAHVDTKLLSALAVVAPLEVVETPDISSLAPLGQRIAVAYDAAFAFAYLHVLESWRDAGAEIAFFSPLADEGPTANADAVYLPGGYPELFAARLSVKDGFRSAMVAARDRGAAIFGECGGYMVLGEELIDSSGTGYGMLGFLPVRTSFAERALHLGYRDVRTLNVSPLGEEKISFRGHEFHYATVLEEGGAPPLFEAENAAGDSIGTKGLINGRVAGSFIHLVDRAG